ncbi:MAG TPA: magnesium transporter CorA family protein [Firmicutes bacterium]|nr:magnesium transporter CorA family protein [Bacillota bacterium]
MIRMLATIEGEMQEIKDPREVKGAWISLINPTEAEIARTVELTGLSADYLRAALDEEELPRLESEDGQVLMIIDVPITRGKNRYDTMPLGIIISQAYMATVTLEENEVLTSLLQSRSVRTAKRTRFLLQILYRTATQYLKYLRQIDRRTDEIESKLHESLRNKELIEMLSLTKSLVYFTTSLHANQSVMERLLRSHLRKTPADTELSPVIKMYEDDEDLLEDVITENKQAIEMAHIYSNILSSMLDAFASLISNNLNIVMKVLTSVTIVLAIPTIVASLYGMNVPLPFQHSPYAFIYVLLLSIGLAGGAIYFMARLRMF